MTHFVRFRCTIRHFQCWNVLLFSIFFCGITFQHCIVGRIRPWLATETRNLFELLLPYQNHNNNNLNIFRFLNEQINSRTSMSMEIILEQMKIVFAMVMVRCFYARRKENIFCLISTIVHCTKRCVQRCKCVSLYFASLGHIHNTTRAEKNLVFPP